MTPENLLAAALALSLPVLPSRVDPGSTPAFAWRAPRDLPRFEFEPAEPTTETPAEIAARILARLSRFDDVAQDPAPSPDLSPGLHPARPAGGGPRGAASPPPPPAAQDPSRPGDPRPGRAARTPRPQTAPPGTRGRRPGTPAPARTRPAPAPLPPHHAGPHPRDGIGRPPPGPAGRPEMDPARRAGLRAARDLRAVDAGWLRAVDDAAALDPGQLEVLRDFLRAQDRPRRRELLAVRDTLRELEHAGAPLPFLPVAWSDPLAAAPAAAAALLGRAEAARARLDRALRPSQRFRVLRRLAALSGMAAEPAPVDPSAGPAGRARPAPRETLARHFLRAAARREPALVAIARDLWRAHAPGRDRLVAEGRRLAARFGRVDADDPAATVARGRLLADARAWGTRVAELAEATLRGFFDRLTPPERAAAGRLAADAWRRAAWLGRQYADLEELSLTP